MISLIRLIISAKCKLPIRYILINIWAFALNTVYLMSFCKNGISKSRNY